MTKREMIQELFALHDSILRKSILVHTRYSEVTLSEYNTLIKQKEDLINQILQKGPEC